MTSPGKPQGSLSNPSRRVRRRDWIAVIVVAALALTLVGYLALRPDGSGANDVADATADTFPSRSGPATSPAPMTTSGATPDPTSPTTAVTPDATDGVVGSIDQPPIVTDTDVGDPEDATRIGPFGDLSRRIEGDPLALGAVDAPVVMVSFEDYRCPFCGQFARETLPKLVETYVEPGILRIEWRDLPIFGEQSMQAAIAGRAAAQQGRFWDFNTAVFADAPTTGHADLTRDDLIDYARQAGVPDIPVFIDALDDPALAAAVEEDIEQGSFLGVPSTPAFVIDGYPIVGAQPFDTFADLIETVQTL